MIWHIVRFDFSSTSDDTRQSIEEQLAGLEGIEEVAWLRVGRDLSDPDVTGLITVFRTEEDLDAYRNHPDHVPVAQAIRDAGLATSRVDLRTPDDVADLPPR
ncbi:MAG TPA: Dabb family protein [Nitriliruptorales bacterium]|nr:Dabb family protein [Nitriliruptorales bacterium]